MAELTTQERLQPSLLDRLTDNEPDRQEESRDQRVLSTRKLRASVLRDLAWLLNSTQLSYRENGSEFAYIPTSVLNYGMPPMTGFTASNLNIDELERAIRQVIRNFEPRLLRNTVRVEAQLQEGLMNHNVLTFQIQADLWARPQPERLYLKTQLDLESGQVRVDDGPSSGQS